MKISQFLNDFDSTILYEHKESLTFFISMLEENEDFGVTEDEDSEGHFRSCPWYFNDCEEGPDTCRCLIFHLRKSIITHLINSYYNTLNH